MLRRSALGLVLLMTAPASAMNWEGHEDGPSTHPYEDVLRLMLPAAQPLPSPDCPVTPDMVAEDPYLQIPLPRHRCPPAANAPEGER